ncbi:MAG: Gfo/Idh/MocA family oxidoreductase [Oscillospiraceae bacterium]|jgi:predicted dehydrogenase|nr:Gfo/Idh/MocA family oxidoreductase [Oscillospiraceae bacterium]
MLKIAAIGLGSRTVEYLTIMRLLRKNDVEITALCDIAPQVLKDIGERFNVPESHLFASAEALFAQGKIADGLIIGTQDATHAEIAKPAIGLGYTILMEKPISGNYAECVQLAEQAKAKGVRIVVCHVLRYHNYYEKIKEIIRSGQIGKLITINHTENVGYFHFAHSYVRGDWKIESESTPALLAKCCHDIDLIQWFFDEKPALSVSSLGDLEYFCRKNAPEGATEFCLGGCAVKEQCPYDAEYHYITSPLHKSTFVKFKKRRLTGKARSTKADVYEALRTGQFGRCVFLNDNDVCDNQTVSVDFGDSQTALLTMTAFSQKCCRKSHFMGAKGELICNHNDLVMNIFGKGRRRFGLKFALPGHGNGDVGLVLRFLKVLSGELEDARDVTFIEQTLPSHAIIAAAEESRHRNGERIRMEKFLPATLAK